MARVPKTNIRRNRPKYKSITQEKEQFIRDLQQRIIELQDLIKLKDEKIDSLDDFLSQAQERESNFRDRANELSSKLRAAESLAAASQRNENATLRTLDQYRAFYESVSANVDIARHFESRMDAAR